MAIDLNGSSVAGQNYITSYREDDPAIGIVSSDVRVGSGSSSVNTDNIRHIRISLTQAHGEDEWVIGAMPAGIIVSLTQNGPAIAVPSTLNALAAPSIYLRTDGRPMPDADWQTALKAIGFFADEAIASSREIVIQAQNSAGAWQVPVTTQINITATNDAPLAAEDTGVATEAGGVNNSTLGQNATGNVLSNDIDPDPGSVAMSVSAFAHEGLSAGPGTRLEGAYGALTLQSDGSYVYVVDENNAVVQGLRNDSFSVTDTFSYTVQDAAGASSTSTLNIIIKGQDDTPFGIAVGQHFDGTAASVVADPTPLGVSRDFAFELRVSPSNGIVLKAQSLTDVAGTSGQEFAVTPLHGQTTWGSVEHVGVGLSVGTNGISVYQHTGGLLSSLLTWSGTVNANTHVAVVFNDNRPSLYLNGTLVATGLQSNKLVHPPTGVGGNNWGYFDGSISDFVVWHGALSAADVAVRALDPSLSDSATPALTLLQVRIPEDAAEGTVVTTVRARDVDNNEVLTYALTSDAQGRFQIDATTGEVRVAPGAVFDHETAHELTLTVRATDLANQSVLHNFTVTIGDVNEAPMLANDSAVASRGFLTLMVDQDHGLWWLDGLGGQRSFVATANEPIGALTRTAEGLYFAVSADTLYRLDPATGHCLAIGSLSTSGNQQMTGLAAAPDGHLYGVNSVGNLFRISATTGAATSLVSVNSSVSSHADVAHVNGALYWTTVFGDLMRYDLVTGQHGVAMTGLPTHGGLSNLSLLMADGDYTLYAVDDTAGKVYRIDLGDHTFTAMDTLLPAHTAGQTLVDGAETASSGNVFANDPASDAGDHHVVTEVLSESPLGNGGPAGTTITGAYGTLLLKADGSYVYEVNASHAAVKGLKTPSDTLEDRFSYVVSDSAGLTATAQLVVTVRGLNHAPQVTSEFVIAVEAGGVHNGTPGHNPSGNLLHNDTDAESGEDLRVSRVLYQGTPLALSTQQALNYGTLTIDEDGTYSYVVNQSNPAVEALRTSLDTLTETITYQVADVDGATQTGTLTIRIEGRDDAPVALTEVVIAVEAGGVHNSTPGIDPTGHVIDAGTDVDDAPGNVRVSQARTQVNLIRNGSFEQAPGSAEGSLLTSAMPHWTNGGATNIKFSRDDTASDGRVSVDLDAWTALDSLRQSNIATQVGRTYELQFDLAPRAGYNGTTVEVYWNDQLVGSAQVDGSGWTTASFQVTALGNDSLRLAELASENDTGGPRIDNVRLYQSGVDQALRGQYGTLTLNEDGSYQYNVDQSNAQVQALRRPEDTLQESFTYTLIDAAGLTSTSTLAVTVGGKNDAPEALVLGRIFNGDSASVITGTPLAASRDFSFALNVSPLENITLHAQSLSGTVGTNGQHYALSPLQGQAVWGSTQHAGLGLSVGSNGISVYQHTGNLLSPLLTWSGTVGANTHVAVNVIDNRPALHVNGQLVATGLQSNHLLHPPTEVGGISWGYFKGSIHDVQVWNGALTWSNGVATPASSTPLFSAATLSLSENSAAGTVVTGLRSSDVDAGDTLTYSLVEDGGGRFVVNANTGVVSVAPGAVLDHEAVGSIPLKARVTDTGGLFQEISFTVEIADINEAPMGVNAEAVMNEDNQVRIGVSRALDILVGGIASPAVRIDSIPVGGSLTLDNQPVAVGQVVAAADAVRIQFKPALFADWFHNLSDPDSGDTVSAVRIISLPSAAQGQLLFDGQPINPENEVILRADIDKLSFEPALNHNGDATFTYRAIDSRGTTQQGEASTFTIHVLPVNDTPVIAPTLSIDVHEGSWTLLEGLHVSDVDSGESVISVTLKVTNGAIHIGQLGGGVEVEGDGTTNVVLRGTMADVNDALLHHVGYVSEFYEPEEIVSEMQVLSPSGTEDPIVRVLFTTPVGTFKADAADGVTLTGNGTDALDVEGRASVVGPYILNQHISRDMPIATSMLTMTVDDMGNTGMDPGLTASDTSEQDVRVIELAVVPVGLPLFPPEQLGAGFTNPAGPHAGGAASVGVVASTPIGAPLTLALGDVSAITNPTDPTNGQQAQDAAAQQRQSLHDSLHPTAESLRHHWQEIVRWLPPTGVQQDGSHEVNPSEPLAPEIQANPFFLFFVFWDLAETLYLYSEFRPNQRDLDGQVLPPPLNTLPQIFYPDEPFQLLEDHTVRINNISFADAEAARRGKVWVRFDLLEPGTLSVDTSGYPGIGVGGNATSSLTLTGTINELNGFMASLGVTYSAAAHANGLKHLQVTINDMGLLGRDPGTSGDGHSEEATTILALDITPVSDAPEGQDSVVEMLYSNSLVLYPERFGFHDVDGDAFTGVQITELPASGQLLLNGQAVEPGQVIMAQAIEGYQLVYVPDANLQGAPVHPRIGFRVMDSGSTENDGQTMAASTNYLNLQVQYPPSLSLSTASITFDEASGQAVAWMNGAQLSDRSSVDASLKTVWIQTGTLAYGDHWGFDPAWLASISAQGPLPFERIEQGNGVTAINFSAGATPGFVQALLDALVFDMQAPNATEGTRHFTVSVEDVDGRSSEAVVVEMTVVSVLGEAMRVLENAHADLMQSFEQTVSGAAGEVNLREGVLTWFEARVALAEAMWSTLALAAVQNGIYSFGPSIRQAFDALTLGVSDLAAALGQNIQFPATLPWLQTVNQGTQVEMLQADMPQWLGRVAQAQVQGIQAIYAELKSMTNPVGTHSAGSGDDAVLAYDLGEATALTHWLRNLGIEPVITSVSGDPATALAQSGSAWVQTTDGHVWLRADQHQQLNRQIEAARLEQLDGAITPLERTVLALLSGTPSESGLLRCDAELLDLLQKIGVSVSTDDLVSLQPTDDPVALLMPPGRIGLSADGTLLMSPLTQQQLMQSLTEVAKADVSVTSPLLQLHRHLGTLLAADGVVTIDADTVQSITRSDLAVRLSSSASDIDRFGTAVAHPTNGTWQVTPATLAGWQQQLQVMTQLSNPIAPYSVAHSDVLHLQAQLETPGQESLYGHAFVRLALSPLLGNLLASQGLEIHQAVGYSSAERDLLIAPRVQSEPRLVLALEADHVLVPASVALQLGHALERSLHDTGLRLGELPPIDVPVASNAPASLAQQLSQAVHAQAMEQVLKQTDRLPTGEVMQLWKAAAQALAPALGLTAEVSIPAGQEPAVPGMALEVSARRWVAELRELGLDVRLVDAADVANGAPAGVWHVAADAQGRALMTSSAHAALTQTLLIQNHASRAALAEGLVDLLTRTDVQHSLSVIDADGQLRTLTAAGASQMGLALVPLSIVEALAALGIALPTTLLRSATPSEVNDVVRLGTEPDTMLVDPERSLALLSHDTLMRLAQDTVLQRIAADEARYTLDPDSVPAGTSPRTLALNTAGMAEALQALDNASVQSDGLVRLTVSTTQLLRAGLAVNELDNITGGASAWPALLSAATMTVVADPAQPGTLLTSQTTLDRLVELASLNLEVVTAVQSGRPVPTSSDLAAAWQLRETIGDGLRITTEGTVLIENATELLVTLTHFGVAYTVVGQVSDSFSDALDALARSTSHGVVTVGNGTDVRVSQATWQSWMTAVEQAVRAQGGAALLDRWTPEGTQAPLAATDWRATTNEVASHDALIDFINAASLNATFTAGTISKLWSWPAGSATGSIAEWQSLIGSDYVLQDVGVIDPLSASGQDALRSAPYVVGHDAVGRLWVSDHMHRILMITLTERLEESREALRAQALDSLVTHPVIDGVARWSDGALIHALQRLGLLDADTLRLHDVPGAPSLTFVDATTVALDAATRDAVIVRLGEMAVLTDSQQDHAVQWLDAVNTALQTLNIGTGQLISVPAGNLLLASVGLEGFTLKPYPTADLVARSQAVIGTILTAADGTLHMQPQTLLMLQAQLKGLTHARTIGEASEAVHFPHLAQVLTALSLAAAQPALLSGSFEDSDIHWGQSLADWHAVPDARIETLDQLLGRDLLSYLKSQGVPLTVLDPTMLIDAAQTGLIHRPFTVISDLQGHLLMSPQTLEQMGHHLVKQLKQSTGLDWTEVFDTRSGTVNALASLFDTVDDVSSIDKRALQQNTTTNHEQARQDTINVFNQLLRSEPAPADNGTLVLLGRNFTSAALDVLLLKLADYGLPHSMVELVTTTNGTVLDGQYAVQGTQLLTTKATALELVRAADLLLRTVQIEQQRELIEQLTGQTYAGAPGLPFVQMTNTTALTDALSLRQISAVTVKDVNGTLHTVAFEELVQVRPDPTRGINTTVSLIDLQGQPFSAQASETDAAWQRLVDGEAYGVKASGDAFISMVLRNELLEQALSGTTASTAVVAQHLLAGLNNATLDNGMQVVESYGLTSFLKDLGIPTLVATSSSGLVTPGAILSLGDNRFGMSNTTLEQIVEKVEQRSLHSAALNQQLLAMLDDGQAIYNASDWLESQSETQLGSRLALTSGVVEGKLVISVTLSDAIVLAMQQAQVIGAPPDPMGTTQNDYNALYEPGEVRRVTSSVAGSQVLVMTTETWSQLLTRWEAAQPSPGQGVVMVDNAGFQVLLEKAGLTPITTTQLKANGTATNHFDTFSEFSKALHESLDGTLFIDARNRVWMTVETHRSLELPAQAAANAADWPLLTQNPGSVADDLARYELLMPLFSGNRMAEEPAGGASGWKGYSLNATEVACLQDLGITLSAPATPLTSLSQLAFAPAYTTQADEAGNQWIDARTYELVSDLVQGRGHALIASLFQNTWERMSVVDDNGNTQVWWRSTAADGELFEQSLSLTGLTLSHRTDLNGTDPVLDLLDDGAAYARDPLGRVFVSDATHASLQAALERVTLQAESGYLTQSFAALNQFVLSEGLDLVRVTDLALQEAIYHHPDIQVNTGPVDLLNLSTDQLKLLQARAVNVLDDGQGNYYLTRTAANRLAGALANGIPELKDAELALPAGPAVVQVRGAQALDFMESRLGMTLSVLTDALGLPVDTAKVSAASLTHAQREWLNSHPGAVVQDRDGHLLMSAQTFESTREQASQQLARTDEQIAEQLTEALSSAVTSQVGTGNGTLTDAVVTLSGPAAGWIDLLREMQMSMEVQLLSTTTTGDTNYAALFASPNPQLGIDMHGQLVMQASLRDTLLPAVATIGLRTHAIASGHLSLVDAIAYDGAVTGGADSLPHPASAYYESSAATSGWARWYGVATGARAYLSADMYIDNKYGAKYQELLGEALNNPTAMVNLMGKGVRVPEAYMLLAYLEDPVGSPRTMSDHILKDDDFELSQFKEEVQVIDDLVHIGQNIASNNIYANWGDTIRVQLNDMRGAFLRYERANDVLRNGMLDGVVTELMHDTYDKSLNAFRFRAEQLLNQLKTYVAPFGRAGLADYLFSNEITNAAIQIKRTLDGLEQQDIAGGRTIHYLEHARETIEASQFMLRDTTVDFETALNNALTAPAIAKADFKNQVLAEIADEKSINDAVTQAQKALQQQRLVSSLGRILFQLGSQAVDTGLQIKKANSLLGDSPEADALRKQYLAGAAATGFSAAGGFFSALQVPVASYRGWVDVPQTFNWQVFREYFTKTNILQSTFVGPGILWNHGTDLPLRASIKEQLFEKIREGIHLSSETNKATGSIYFLANIVGMLAGLAQMAQGAYTPDHMGNYLMVRGMVSFLAGAPSLLADAFGALSKNPALINQGAYLNAVGHVGLQMGLPLMDALAYLVLYYGFNDPNVSAGTLANSLLSAVLYGVGLGVISANWPIGLSLMVAANIDFSAVFAAITDSASYHALTEQGRAQEAQVANEQWWRDLFKSIPVINTVLWPWWAHEAHAGTPTELTRAEYEQAVTERVKALETTDKKLSQHALEIAQMVKAEDQFYLIEGWIDDFPYQINDGIRVIKSVVVSEVSEGVANTQADVRFYDASVDITGAANNFRNEAVITVALPNLTGGLATYYIAPETTAQLSLITDPVRAANMLIDTSGSSADSGNRFLVYNARVAIVGGAGDDEYLLMQALTPELNSKGKRVVGYIQDGWSGFGSDLVNFTYAENAVSIHTGVSYNGLTAYDGIRQFVGSWQADFITRYASHRSDATVVIDAATGTGRDLIDLRGGNNIVMLGSGVVRLGESGVDAVATNAQSVGMTVDLEGERLKGPWKTNEAEYSRLFDNTFDATNDNVINVMTTQAVNPSVQVYGSAFAMDTLAFSLLSTGVDLQFNTTNDTYRFFSYGQGTTGAGLGFADTHIDKLIGSTYADRIVIDSSNATLKQIQGGGGDDYIQVNRSGLTIETNDGRSNVVLGSAATSSQVFAGVGTQVVVDTDVATALASDKITVVIDHNLPGVAPEDGTTRLDARTSNVALYVRANAGSVDIDLGTGDATVEIGENVTQVVIRDTSADIGQLQLLFRNADQSFDLIDDLQAVNGTWGHFSRDTTNTQVFHSVWTSSSGRQVDIRIEAADESLDEVFIGGAFAAASTYQQLEQLVA